MPGIGSREQRRKKRWPGALKREIVAATLKPSASVSVVARSSRATSTRTRNPCGAHRRLTMLNGIQVFEIERPQVTGTMRDDEIYRGGGEDGVDGVAARMRRIGVSHPVLGLEVADDGGDG
jgi:hypothetical protein